MGTGELELVIIGVSVLLLKLKLIGAIRFERIETVTKR